MFHNQDFYGRYDIKKKSMSDSFISVNITSKSCDVECGSALIVCDADPDPQNLMNPDPG